MGAGLPAAQRDVLVANWYYDHRDWTAAVSTYERAIAMGKDNPDVRTDLGNSYRFSGNWQKALEQYHTAQKLDSRHEQSLFNQGGLYAEDAHDPVKAIGIWREFIERFPQSASVANAKQLIAAAQNQIASAALTGPANKLPFPAQDREASAATPEIPPAPEKPIKTDVVDH